MPSIVLVPRSALAAAGGAGSLPLRVVLRYSDTCSIGGGEPGRLSVDMFLIPFGFVEISYAANASCGRLFMACSFAMAHLQLPGS